MWANNKICQDVEVKQFFFDGILSNVYRTKEKMNYKNTLFVPKELQKVEWMVFTRKVKHYFIVPIFVIYADSCNIKSTSCKNIMLFEIVQQT